MWPLLSAPPSSMLTSSKLQAPGSLLELLRASLQVLPQTSHPSEIRAEVLLESLFMSSSGLKSLSGAKEIAQMTRPQIQSLTSNGPVAISLFPSTFKMKHWKFPFISRPCMLKPWPPPLGPPSLIPSVLTTHGTQTSLPTVSSTWNISRLCFCPHPAHLQPFLSSGQCQMMLPWFLDEQVCPYLSPRLSPKHWDCLPQGKRAGSLHMLLPAESEP